LKIVAASAVFRPGSLAFRISDDTTQGKSDRAIAPGNIVSDVSRRPTKMRRAAPFGGAARFATMGRLIVRRSPAVPVQVAGARGAGGGVTGGVAGTGGGGVDMSGDVG
jgi:hypothetical protein